MKFEGEPRQVLGAGHVLITTRRSGFGYLGPVLDLDVLLRPEAISLLRRQTGLTPLSVESLERMSRSAARMARLISDLLDYARTRAPGGLPVVLARADLHAICKDAVEECRSAHPATAIVLETMGDATGSWDADRIEQALINLITNAIQYGGTSVVRIQSIASASHFVEIKVHNGGAVIPADVLPELFKAYRRGIRGLSTGRRGGLGLGLFIVAQIAAAHGGLASRLPV